MVAGKAGATGALIVGLGLSAVADAAIIASENFDGGATNLISFSQSVSDFTTAGDMFGVRSRSTILGGFGLPFAITDDSVVGAAGNSTFPTDNQGIVGQNKTDAFFGIADLTNTGNPGGTGRAEWNFNIGGATGLSLSIDVGAMGDFETGESFIFSVAIDGGAFTNVLQFLPDESATKTYRPMDIGTFVTLDDPLVEIGFGIFLDKMLPTTGALAGFGVSILGTGSVLTLRLDASQDGASEAFAFDNIVIWGTPAAAPLPSTLALFGLGLAGLGLQRRRRAS